jgi:hypothetical protein
MAFVAEAIIPPKPKKKNEASYDKVALTHPHAVPTMKAVDKHLGPRTTCNVKKKDEDGHYMRCGCVPKGPPLGLKTMMVMPFSPLFLSRAQPLHLHTRPIFILEPEFYGRYTGTRHVPCSKCGDVQGWVTRHGWNHKVCKYRLDCADLDAICLNCRVLGGCFLMRHMLQIYKDCEHTQGPQRVETIFGGYDVLDRRCALLCQWLAIFNALLTFVLRPRRVT